MLKIEFVIRPKDEKPIPQWVRDIFAGYIVLESPQRLIANVPTDWQGFRDGTIIRLISEMSTYVALAWITDNEREIVTDFEGELVERYEDVIGGRKCYKYVKKRLRIVRIINEEDEIFYVLGYVLNIDYPDPVVKVLEVYSVGKESGLRLKQFVEKKSNN